MSVGSSPLLDPEALERLESWGGAELRTKLIGLFFRNGPERMQGIRDGLGGDDLELAERSAHSLKSSAANLGGEAVRRLAARIEEALEAGDRSAAAAALPELEARFAETLEALGEIGKGEDV